MLNIPPYLNQGDTVGIVSPASSAKEELVRSGIKLIEQQGFVVKKGKHALTKSGYFAGTDKQRLEDMQTMLDDPDIKAIFCTRGGYGTYRIISRLDFSSFLKNPKWLIGFSDITVLHACLNGELDIASIHGPMPVQFSKSEVLKKNMQETLNLLKGENIEYTWESSHDEDMDITGELFGGNLSILTSLIGTTYEPSWENKILFLEDVGEYLYKIDRMLWQLNYTGVFMQIKALVLGQFTDLKDTTLPFGATIHEIFEEHVGKFNIPIISGFPAGHGDINMPLIFGKDVRLKVTGKIANLKYLNY